MHNLWHIYLALTPYTMCKQEAGQHLRRHDRKNMITNDQQHRWIQGYLEWIHKNRIVTPDNHMLISAMLAAHLDVVMHLHATPV